MQYDVLHRLIRIDYGNGVSIAYTYDAAGNRLTLVAKTNAPALLAIAPTSINYSSAAVTGRKISVSANVPWAATESLSWVTITGGRSGAANGTVTYSVTANSGMSSRTGRITISGGGITRTCTVTQAGLSSPVSHFTYSTSGGRVAITGYTGPGGAVIIPSTINGLPVTSIGSGAFMDCRRLTGVTIPGSVTSIERGAFLRCTALVSVTLHTGVARIGVGAFEQCSQLSTLTLPSSVASIGEMAFRNCNRMTRIYFRGNAPIIGSKVFDLADKVTIYYLMGKIGWGSTFGGRPTRVGADAYERDNSSSSAKPIGNGQTQTRNIHAAGNTDWVKFRVIGSGARNLQLDTAGPRGDTQMWLYKGDGTLVAYNDNGGEGNFSLIKVSSLAPGTYYIKIREHGNDGRIRLYTLKARWQSASSGGGDSYEPDNSASAAKFIANRQTQTRSIHTAGNVDWVKFRVGSAGARDVLLATEGESGDTQMWLYKQNSAGTGAGTEIAYNDDSERNLFAWISLSFLPPETYYIKIQEYGNNGTIPAYLLKATWTTP